MTIFSAICAAAFLFLIMRNISSSMELKRYSQGETLYIMKETRRGVLIGRIFAAVLLLAVVVLFIYDIVFVENFFDVDAFRSLALVLGLGLFAFVPFSTSRWVITPDGLFLYNNNLFIPWSQLITAGVSTRRGKTFITLQVKKETGEFFKQTYYILMVKPEDAERLCEMMKQFIRSIDKMKRIKHIQDEKKKPAKKRTWY